MTISEPLLGGDEAQDLLELLSWHLMGEDRVAEALLGMRERSEVGVHPRFRCSLRGKVIRFQALHVVVDTCCGREGLESLPQQRFEIAWAHPVREDNRHNGECRLH